MALYKIRSLLITLVLFALSGAVQAMVFDNRYFPLLQYPYINVPGRESHVTGDLYVTTAGNATDDRNRAIGIAQLSGSFDQSQLGYAMILAGYPNLLSPLLMDGALPWILSGKLQTQGFALSYRQYFGYNFSAGLLGLVMRSNSYIDFQFNPSVSSSLTPMLTESDIIALDNTRLQMLAALGLSCNHVQQAGIGDIEAYLRWNNRYDYYLKFRSFEYAFRLGALIPTGVKKNISKPASVPFGGNGHWGIYGSIDGEFELREDWKVGALLRISKRFSLTNEQRMPADQEPQIFGAVVGLAKVNPGFAEIFCLYGEIEGLREGFGLRLQYSLVNHNQDDWTDERVDKTVPVNLKGVQDGSNWASEYVTLTGFYDFGKTEGECGYKPIIRAIWDIPFTLLVGHRFVHSYKVALGLEFNF